MASRKRKIAFETLEAPVRSNYFHGMLLGERDFQREQDYFRNKVRLALRLAHGWGIVSGLEVSVSQGQVVVAPGVAIDCRGQDLVVPVMQKLPLAGPRGKRYVTLRLHEEPIEPVPIPGENEASVAYAATRESARVELVTVDPLAGHGRFRPRDRGCGVAHALAIATVSCSGAKWRVTATPGLRARRK